MMQSPLQEQEKTQLWLNQFDKRPGDRPYELRGV